MYPPPTDGGFEAGCLARGLMQVMDVLGVGIGLLGADCRPAFRNARMDRVLAEAEGIRLSASGHLTSDDPDCASAIKELAVGAVSAMAAMPLW